MEIEYVIKFKNVNTWKIRSRKVRCFPFGLTPEEKAESMMADDEVIISIEVIS